MTLRTCTRLLLLSVLLGGCNDSNDAQQTPSRKMGYGETELLDPVNRPQGSPLPIGATAVLLLEAASSSAAPGDTGAVGYDEVWFDLEQPASLNIGLKEQDLQVVGRLELWGSTGGLHQVVDPSQLSARVQLPTGRYGLRVHASHHQPHPVPTFIRLTRQPRAGMRDPVDWDSYSADLVANGGCQQCDLAGADLRGYDMWGMSFRGSDLSNADLGPVTNPPMVTDLTNADLSGANLTNTNLEGANLTNADLSGANPANANLSGAKLIHANLSGANLASANLAGADLSRANLTSANLDGADLTNVNLSGADLTGANLNGAKLVNVTVNGTNFSLATWTFGGIHCAPGSIDGCNGWN